MLDNIIEVRGNPVREMVKTTMPDDLNGNGVESVERWARKKKAHADAVRLDPATALWDEKRKFRQYVAGCPSVRVGTLKYRPDVLDIGFLRLQAEEEVKAVNESLPEEVLEEEIDRVRLCLEGVGFTYLDEAGWHTDRDG